MPAGAATTLLKLNTKGKYEPNHYKYIIVLLGSSAMSTSGRLAHLIAHSGAVILLQSSSFSYHFSTRLKPWVHYIPLTYSGSDLISKILWLQKNDNLAQQIAINAINFGKSYLRLEDYYCYAISALEILGNLQMDSDALHPFKPRKRVWMEDREDDFDALELT